MLKEFPAIDGGKRLVSRLVFARDVTPWKLRNVMRKIPKRLKIEPLLESVWEMRFSSNSKSAASILPGLIFHAFGEDYKEIESLPLAGLPVEARSQDPNLRYQPTLRLLGAPYIIQIGDQVASLICSRPYTGWENFGGKIRTLASAIKDTNIITRPERFSLKYVNILNLAGAPSLDPLEVNIRLGKKDLRGSQVSIRAETREKEFITLTQVSSSAQARFIDGSELSGILIENDTIYNNVEGDFWDNHSKLLDSMHEFNKKSFFNLLKESTIANLEPEY